MNHRLKNRSRHPARRGHALATSVTKSAAMLAAMLALAAGPAHAITFLAYAKTSGTPGPGGDHIFSNAGAAPVQVASSHDGQRTTPHQSGLLSTSISVQSQAFARADFNGLHLDTRSTGSVRDAEPFYSGGFATQSNARAGLGDSFVLALANPQVGVLTTSMTLSFSVHANMSGYANGSVIDPQYSAGEGRAEWSAEFVARDDTAGIELGRITLYQGCAVYIHVGTFGCVGDAPGLHGINITAPFGHTLSISMGGETWASAAGGQGRGGDALSGGYADLGHTIAWAGISNLRDQNGLAIASYTAISPTSGYDYVTPFASAVPEPAAAALMLAGLAGLAARRRGARAGER